MKPNFNPKRGDIVRVRHPELGVVDAEYYWHQSLNKDCKDHIVTVFGCTCRAQRLKPHIGIRGIVLDRVRFVYPFECMPDYKKQV